MRAARMPHRPARTLRRRATSVRRPVQRRREVAMLAGSGLIAAHFSTCRSGKVGDPTGGEISAQPPRPALARFRRRRARCLERAGARARATPGRAGVVIALAGERQEGAFRFVEGTPANGSPRAQEDDRRYLAEILARLVEHGVGVLVPAELQKSLGEPGAPSHLTRIDLDQTKKLFARFVVATGREENATEVGA